MNLIRCIFVLATFPWIAAFAMAGSDEANDVESQVKATYLYKFASYVEWPPSSFAQTNAPLIIGVVGADEIAADLSSLVGTHAASDRLVVVKTLKPGDPLSAVHILFIGKQENGVLKRILYAAQSQPVLTVTESIGALDAGSVINFVTIDDRIRFEVSLTQAERCGLKISARLLKVAQKIESLGH